VRLQRIPLELLLLLVQRRGQLVTREEILERIWGKEVFLDTESSINTAVLKLRRAMRDNRGAPRFIATVPAKGYRFIAEVHEPILQGDRIRDSQTASADNDRKTTGAYAGPTGERRRLTVPFCHLGHFSSGEEQRDSEDWWEMVADYHRIAAQAIERFGGHVGQSRGNGVMAYFGWPEAHDNDADCAIRAGLTILEVISTVNPDPATRPKLSPRIGIDSGAVVVEGGVGKDADLFGEPPDVAEQVAAAADPGTVLITAETHRLVSGRFVVEDRGTQVLKNIDRPVQLYGVIQPSGMRGRFEAAAAAGRLTPFVGREDELRSLMNRWERALDGEGQMVLIAGEGGIGKSRLLHRFRQQIADTPHTWIEVEASALFQNTLSIPSLK
jgi:class 3 adenylate cyclase